MKISLAKVYRRISTKELLRNKLSDLYTDIFFLGQAKKLTNSDLFNGVFSEVNGKRTRRNGQVIPKYFLSRSASWLMNVIHTSQSL